MRPDAESLLFYEDAWSVQPLGMLPASFPTTPSPDSSNSQLTCSNKTDQSFHHKLENPWYKFFSVAEMSSFNS